METIQDILDKTLWLLWNGKERTNDADLKAYLNSAIAHLRYASESLDSNSNRVIAFMGRTNVGKSTLMNALLEGMVAPVHNGDWSARPVEYRYSPEQSILLAENYPPREIPFHSQKELQEALRSLSTMDNPGDAIGHEQVVVKLNANVLKSGLILCDMPGFLACTGEEEESTQGTHHADIDNYLQKQSGITTVFLVTNALLPEASVIQYIKEHLSGQELHIVVNYRHASENIAERKNTLEEAWRNSLQRVLTFHYIDAKQSLLESTTERDELLTYLRNFATQDGKASMARETLVQAMEFVGLKMKDFSKYPNPKTLFETTRLNVVHQLLRNFGDPKVLKVFEQTWRINP